MHFIKEINKNNANLKTNQFRQSLCLFSSISLFQPIFQCLSLRKNSLQ